MKYLNLIFLFISVSTWAVDCPEFETSLQNILKRINNKNEQKLIASSPAKFSSTPKIEKFKATYAEELRLRKDANRDFMLKMEQDAGKKNGKQIYFDVENAVQKKLNDQIFGEKTMVDAVNTSFLKKFYKNVQDNPELRARISGEYKDYKSLRLRLNVLEGDSKDKIEQMLDLAYKKSVKEFSTELKDLEIAGIIKTRTDDVANPERWFLAGTGENSLEANMAARGARTISASEAQKNNVLKYHEHIDVLHKDVSSIEGLRIQIASDKALVNSGLIDQLENGKVIPSKEVINILRKYKPGDFSSDELYFQAINGKFKKVFGKELPEATLTNLTNYQKKVDSLSPPLFVRERTEINLEQAKEGIVSVDFTGVGVDNLYQQMKGLAGVNYQEASKANLLKNAFTNVQKNVDQVTEDMNQAKRLFTKSVQNVEKSSATPLFSGDDGIHMPEMSAWDKAKKTHLVSELAKTNDPSKYRVTFVKTKYADGSIIPASERSNLIVRAETIEKKLREEMVGVDGLSAKDAKKIITAIDFTPAKNGGTINVLVGGSGLTKENQQAIQAIVQKLIKKEEGETFGQIIMAE